MGTRRLPPLPQIFPRRYTAHRRRMSTNHPLRIEHQSLRFVGLLPQHGHHSSSQEIRLNPRFGGLLVLQRKSLSQVGGFAVSYCYAVIATYWPRHRWQHLASEESFWDSCKVVCSCERCSEEGI